MNSDSTSDIVPAVLLASASSSRSKGRVKELDGIRAFAILVVLGCHYQGFAPLFGGLPEFGWIGVDIFFVLSGYLITTILLSLRNRPHPYKTFYSRRAIRILPPYGICSILVILFAVIAGQYIVLSPSYLLKQVFFLQAFYHERFLLSWLLHPLHQLANMPSLLAMAQHLPPATPGLVPTAIRQSGVYWSLSIEEYFYLVWAPVVLMLPRKGITLIGIGVCAIEILLRWSVGSMGAYFSMMFRFDALLYGAFLALFLEQERFKPANMLRILQGILVASCLGLCAILITIAPILGKEIRQSPLFLSMGLPLLSLATAAILGMLVLRQNSNWWFARFWRLGFVQLIGTVSYTMYLCHLLVATGIHQVLSVFHFNPSPVSLFFEALLDVAVTTFMALLSWHYIEKPLLRWKDRRFPGPAVEEPALN